MMFFKSDHTRSSADKNNVALRKNLAYTCGKTQYFLTLKNRKNKLLRNKNLITNSGSS